MQTMSNNKPSGKRFFLLYVIIAITVTVFGGVFSYNKYTDVYSPNVSLNKSETYIYIPSGANFNQVADTLIKKGYIRDKASFEWVAEKKNYVSRIRSGKYKLQANMSNNDLVNMLRSGAQTPVKVTFNNVRTKSQLAGKLSLNIEADSTDILKALNNPEVAKKFGLSTNTMFTMFIPNTYEVYWNTSIDKLFDKMAVEYKKFWTAERKKKAKAIDMSQTEVITLASIVQAEQNQHNSEKSTIAGLYMNRIKIGMRLQSCPTVIYAIGDFSKKRVTLRDKDFISPFNTYKHKGLPPGPINLPEISSIDAVLNYKTNKYLYMCARDDFSGYHYFSRTFVEHKRHADKFQAALNKQKIYK